LNSYDDHISGLYVIIVTVDCPKPDNQNLERQSRDSGFSIDTVPDALTLRFCFASSVTISHEALYLENALSKVA